MIIGSQMKLAQVINLLDGQMDWIVPQKSNAKTAILAVNVGLKMEHTSTPLLTTGLSKERLI